MVVICPSCGREIFSDPDSCVMCGWRRGAPSPRQQRREPNVDYTRERPQSRPPVQRPPPQRPPPRQYPRERPPRRYREPYPREQEQRAQRPRDYPDEPRRRYPREEERYYQQRPREDPRMQRGYPERDGRGERRQNPPIRNQRPYSDERREDPYGRRTARERPDSRYNQGYRQRMDRDAREPGYREPGRDYCPNCAREMLTDPDNCVICGWSKSSQDRRGPPMQEPRRGYPNQRDQRYPQENRPRYPPEGWERRVEEKMGVSGGPQSREGRRWLGPDKQPRVVKKEGARDRLVCENCGNPSLQFFADGLGRCPGCGYRFRYSSRPQTARSKQRHKQFICSNCDSKNLQFFLDGTGLCPQCRREFRWSK